MKSSDRYEDIREIADAVCDGDVSKEQVEQLELSLTGDPEAQRFYSDYISMHINLSTKVDDNQEFVYRRISEEFIVRPKGASPESVPQRTLEENVAIADQRTGEVFESNATVLTPQPTTSASNNKPFVDKLKIDHNQSQHDSKNNKLSDRNSSSRHKVFLFALLFIGLLIYAIWQSLKQVPLGHIANIMQGQLSIVEIGNIDNKVVFAGQYRVEQDVELQLVSGDILKLSSGSNFKLFNANEIELNIGSITLSSVANNNIVFHSKSFSLYSNGDDLTLDLTADSAQVTSAQVRTGKNTVLLPKRWRPEHYWSFEGASDRAVDSAGSAHGITDSGVSHVKGLLGAGAYSFDNSENARIDVGSGGGTAPATGSFAVVDGVTIEALIRPNFSSKRGEIDEIFRKDQSDREYRMLLSFQNDRGKSFLRPDKKYAESLSFGLYLVGQGYHELKLPLDGINGRPTLEQLKTGRTHHVAATYNVKTGLKAIYIDGVMHASYQYPAGSKMLSGGSGKASIGNTPNRSRWELEAFEGVIDEVAFYDFALPEMMINQHGKNIKSGVNYYGLRPSEMPLPEKLKMSLPANQLLNLDTLSGLPVSVLESVTE